jgi:hypothetical protein
MSKYEKVYVAVNLDVNEEGITQPRSLKMDDIVYEIDRVKDIRPRASTKVGGCGMRYTIRIEGEDSYLFEEDGRWFVEKRLISW